MTIRGMMLVETEISGRSYYFLARAGTPYEDAIKAAEQVVVDLKLLSDQALESEKKRAEEAAEEKE